MRNRKYSPIWHVCNGDGVRIVCHDKDKARSKAKKINGEVFRFDRSTGQLVPCVETMKAEFQKKAAAIEAQRKAEAEEEARRAKLNEMQKVGG
jgi:hypothetical protein